MPTVEVWPQDKKVTATDSEDLLLCYAIIMHKKGALLFLKLF